MTFDPSRVHVRAGTATTTVQAPSDVGGGAVFGLEATVAGTVGGSARANLRVNCSTPTHNDASWISSCGDFSVSGDAEAGGEVTISFGGGCPAARICLSGASEIVGASWSGGYSEGRGGTAYGFSGCVPTIEIMRYMRIANRTIGP